MARFTAEGCIEFLGRADDQVKVRGYRIELGEIEAVLGSHPGVRECAVTVLGEDSATRRLAAYVVGDRDVGDDALRGFLQRELPEYMVPAAIVRLERLPLTPSGKVDRRSLPTPERAAGESFVPPRTPTERVIAEIWREVLGGVRVGAHDDFFALGGHSLMATRVVSRIRKHLELELPLRALFQKRTVSALAAHVDGLITARELQHPDANDSRDREKVSL
jgi:acyl carrier protein